MKRIGYTRLTIYLPDAVHADVKRWAATHRRDMQEMVAMLLEETLRLPGVFDPPTVSPSGDAGIRRAPLGLAPGASPPPNGWPDLNSPDAQFERLLRDGKTYPEAKTMVEQNCDATGISGWEPPAIDVAWMDEGRAKREAREAGEISE